MATSRIPTVKEALKTIIDAAIPGEVLVSRGTPRGDKGREWVRIGRVSGPRQAVALGRQRFEENFTVDILFSVVKAEIETAEAVEDRAFELAGLAETAIRADETLGGLTWPGGQLVWARIESLNEDDGLAGGERWAEVVMRVGCKARI